MVANIASAGTGCCAICGFITNNQVLIVVAGLATVGCWIYILVTIILNCYRRTKSIKLRATRRKRHDPSHHPT